jgi:hypothetical protein
MLPHSSRRVLYIPKDLPVYPAQARTHGIEFSGVLFFRVLYIGDEFTYFVA